MNGVQRPESLNAIGPRSSQYCAGDVDQEQSAHRLSHDVGHALVIHAGAQEGATDLQHSELTDHRFRIVGGLRTTEIAAAFLVPRGPPWRRPARWSR
jgi:hypothetical protein